MLSGFSAWHALILLGFLLIFVPLIGIFVSVNRRKTAIAEGQIVVGETSNTLAIVAFVLSFVAAIPAVVCGHIALNQINRTSERGWGFAIASLWIGYYAIGLFVLVMILGGVAAVLSR